MNKLINNQQIQTFIQQVPTLKTKLDDTTKIMGDYLSHLKGNHFLPKENETIVEEYKRKESLLDVIKTTIVEREKVNESGKEIVNEMKKVMEIIEKIIEEGKNDEKTVKEMNNQLVDEIIEGRRKEMEEKIAPLKAQIKEIKEDFEKQKEEFEKDRRDETDEEKEERLMKEYEREVKKFGGYLNTHLTIVGNWTTDSNAFVFTLKSSGRNLGMREFNVKSNQTIRI